MQIGTWPIPHFLLLAKLFIIDNNFISFFTWIIKYIFFFIRVSIWPCLLMRTWTNGWSRNYNKKNCLLKCLRKLSTFWKISIFYSHAVGFQAISRWIDSRYNNKIFQPFFLCFVVFFFAPGFSAFSLSSSFVISSSLISSSLISSFSLLPSAIILCKFCLCALPLLDFCILFVFVAKIKKKIMRK